MQVSERDMHLQFLCAIHFEDSEYTDTHRRNRLKALEAVPTTFNIPYSPPKFANRRPALREKMVIATGGQNSPSPLPFPSYKQSLQKILLHWCL
ncbi:hypothetical protein PoB_007172700 [Plakobranchus ocellatus]|uniref:THAP-type domain-containing protein n=1 Tax=Plakobranchus ocellatus TaxID=259542 RepID=A0AAV4DLT6_9GAST|nr:hypothetical protein PoB_007172700 [Plakobranchus ocellatus]